MRTRLTIAHCEAVATRCRSAKGLDAEVQTVLKSLVQEVAATSHNAALGEGGPCESGSCCANGRSRALHASWFHEGSQDAPLRQRDDRRSGDDQVVENADVDQGERALPTVRQSTP